MMARTDKTCEMALRPEESADCQIIAECEHDKVDLFATFDGGLISKLKNPTTVFVRTPENCWRRLAVPRGAQPRARLEPEHPLFNAPWTQ